MRNQTVVPTRN